MSRLEAGKWAAFTVIDVASGTAYAALILWPPKHLASFFAGAALVAAIGAVNTYFIARRRS